MRIWQRNDPERLRPPPAEGKARRTLPTPMTRVTIAVVGLFVLARFSYCPHEQAKAARKTRCHNPVTNRPVFRRSADSRTIWGMHGLFPPGRMPRLYGRREAPLRRLNTYECGRGLVGLALLKKP